MLFPLVKYVGYYTYCQAIYVSVMLKYIFSMKGNRIFAAHTMYLLRVCFERKLSVFLGSNGISWSKWT